MSEGLAIGAVALAVIGCDLAARPTSTTRLPLRSLEGTALLLCVGQLTLGLSVTIIGSWSASAVVTILLLAALALISNVKRSVLGEPLVFSDLVLIKAVFQHPQFYVSALKAWQTALIAGSIIMVFAVLATFATSRLEPRLAGAMLALGAALALTGLLRLPLWTRLAVDPALERDVARHGLFAVLLAYWHHWRKLEPLPVCTAAPLGSETPGVVVVVQCESYADPAELFGSDLPKLAGLSLARSQAIRSGRLLVSGFGAYTMRTEFGVMFGIGEERLGLRRFDPFLDGVEAVSWALPQRLADAAWHRVFVHPHDLRFYGRDRLMRAAGYDRIIGEDEFAPPAPGAGRYVTDQAVCNKILEIVETSKRATLIYAVTIENHGPWPAAKGAAASSNQDDYVSLLQRSDAMLLRLSEALAQAGRPAILCFFGDHRPSIPEVSEPGGDRHTPYAIVQFDAAGHPVGTSGQSEDVTPAQLHHLLLDAIRSWTR